MARGTAAGEIARALEADLRAGRLVPGQRLIEADLTERFGVGRGVVRESLRLLAAGGYVTLEANRGAAIRRLTAEDVADIFDVRAQLEGLAARRAAERGAGPGLAELWQRMEAAFAAVDPLAYATLNTEFHEAVMAAAGNPFLVEAAERLRTPILRYQFLVLMDRAALERSHADHVRIVAAIRAGDGAAAEAEMRAHVASARAHVLARR